MYQRDDSFAIRTRFAAFHVQDSDSGQYSINTEASASQQFQLSTTDLPARVIQILILKKMETLATLNKNLLKVTLTCAAKGGTKSTVADQGLKRGLLEKCIVRVGISTVKATRDKTPTFCSILVGIITINMVFIAFTFPRLPGPSGAVQSFDIRSRFQKLSSDLPNVNA